MDGVSKQELLETMNELQSETRRVAEDHGFHDDDDNSLKVPTMLALIGTEVSEAIEAHRKGQTNDIPSELADIVIRTLDLAETLHISLAEAILHKHEFNKTRPVKHGGKLY